MRLLKKDKDYMRSRKFKKLDNKSKSYLRQKMRKVVKKKKKSKKKDKKLNYKQATKLKKSLSSGFKDTDIRELNTSVASEKKQKYVSYWIGKIQIICDGEVSTRNFFNSWEKEGTINSVKDKRIDLAMYNYISTYLETNTYKSI